MLSIGEEMTTRLSVEDNCLAWRISEISAHTHSLSFLMHTIVEKMSF